MVHGKLNQNRWHSDGFCPTSCRHWDVHLVKYEEICTIRTDTQWVDDHFSLFSSSTSYYWFPSMHRATFNRAWTIFWRRSMNFLPVFSASGRVSSVLDVTAAQTSKNSCWHWPTKPGLREGSVVALTIRPFNHWCGIPHLVKLPTRTHAKCSTQISFAMIPTWVACAGRKGKISLMDTKHLSQSLTVGYVVLLIVPIWWAHSITVSGVDKQQPTRFKNLAVTVARFLCFDHFSESARWRDDLSGDFVPYIIVFLFTGKSKSSETRKSQIVRFLSTSVFYSPVLVDALKHLHTAKEKGSNNKRLCTACVRSLFLSLYSQ